MILTAFSALRFFISRGRLGALGVLYCDRRKGTAGSACHPARPLPRLLCMQPTTWLFFSPQRSDLRPLPRPGAPRENSRRTLSDRPSRTGGRLPPGTPLGSEVQYSSTECAIYSGRETLTTMLPASSFRKKLKRKEKYANDYEDREHVLESMGMGTFIDRYCYRNHLHSALGYRSPTESDEWARPRVWASELSQRRALRHRQSRGASHGNAASGKTHTLKPQNGAGDQNICQSETVSTKGLPERLSN